MRLAAIFAFLAALLSLAAGQAVVISGDAGYNSNSPYNQLYNTNSVFTFKGKVTGMEIAPPMKGMGNVVTILVKSTKGQTWHVDVGPEWYVNNQVTKIKVGDAVQVTGSRVRINGADVVLASQIVKNKNVLALRRPMGRPFWDAVVSTAPNEQGVKLISGTITALDTFVDGTNGPTQRLRIRTDDGEILVALGPEWFMERQSLQMSLGQTVNVNTFAPFGTPTQTAGTNLAAPPIVFATSIGFGQQWMVLRSVNGRPAWFPIGN